MAEIPSIETIERTFGSTWDAVRADVLSHLYLLLVLYQSVHITTPETTFPRVDLDAVRENPLYQLTKDAGLLWLAPVLLLVGLLTYRGLLRWVAGILVQIQSIILDPLRPSDAFPNSGKVNASLALVAFTLHDPDFTLSDIYRQLAMLSAKYRIKKPADYTAFWNSLPTRNAYVYVGNASVFLAAWLLVGGVPDHAGTQVAWATVNFWMGTLLLVVFWAWAWIRWRRLMLIMPAMELLHIGGLIWNDVELKGLEEWMKVSGDQTIKRVRQLREEETKSRPSRPLLVRQILIAIGLPWGEKREGPRKKGWPARAVYERGNRFSWDEGSRGTGLEWLKGYASFVYYILHIGFRVRVGGIWTRFLTFVFGPPPPR
mgnify:CR=1 FL=1